MIEFWICCFMSIHINWENKEKHTRWFILMNIVLFIYTRKRTQHGDSTDTTLFLLWSGRNAKIPQQKIN